MQTTLRLRIELCFCAGAMLAIFFQSTFASAIEMPSVVIAVPGVSMADTKAYATSKDKVTLSEYLETSRPGADRSTELKKRFERAQRFWLSGDTENARAEFRALGELSLKADWQSSQREVLQTAYLRLAQSAASGTERASWLETAVRWYSDLTPDTSLFPPPLLAEFEDTRRRLLEGAVEFDARDIFPDARFVLIDGRKIQVSDANAITVPSGIHRVTALSDTHASITEFLTGAQLRLFRAVPPLLVEGACASARLKATSEPSAFVNAEIYKGRECSPESLQLKPQLLGQSTGRGQNSNQGFLQTNEPAPRSTAETLKKNWLWIIGGAVIAGAGYALAHEMNKDPGVEPVRRTGF